MRIALVAVAASVSALLSSLALERPARAAPTSAPVMSMIEQDLDGDTYPVPRGRALIDINSAVAITVDRAAVARAVEPTSGPATAALVSDYAMFQKAVAAIPTAALTALTKKTASQQNLTPVQRREKLVQAIRQAADASLPLFEYATGTSNDPAALARRKAFRDALDTALGQVTAGTSIAAQNLLILQAAQGELQRLQAELTTALQTEGINLVMGAWLGTTSGATPVHLPNFDDYPELPRTEMERFQVVFTPQEQQQYQRAQAAATMINGGQAADAARQVVTALVDQYFTATLNSLKALRTATQALRQAVDSSAATLITDVTALDDLVAADVLWLQQTIAALEGLLSSDPSGLVSAIQQDWTELKSRAQAVDQSLQKVDKDLIAATGDVKTAAGNVDKVLQDVKTSLSDDVTNLATAIGRTVNGVQLNAAALTFGEKIRRFSLDSLPASTSLDAARAGARSDGDELVVKFGIERPGARVQDIDVQSLVLRRLMLHVQTAAGLVFATRPRLASDTGKNVPFQAAPAYSAFLKKGWRGCPFWNNLLTPGIGISVAALDFDLDGVPEVGIGAAVSLLRDWLQGGVGYNLFDRRWYGFIGIGLPLPTFGMVTTTNGGTSASSGAQAASPK